MIKSPILLVTFGLKRPFEALYRLNGPGGHKPMGRLSSMGPIIAKRGLFPEVSTLWKWHSLKLTEGCRSPSTKVRKGHVLGPSFDEVIGFL